MDIYLDLNSETPIYQQIRDQVVLGLAEGRLAEGESLPSTRQLAADFGINFHTVNKAYDLLRNEGFLKVNRKTGAVVVIEEATQGFTNQWTDSARIWLAEAWLRGMTKDEVLKRCETVLDSFALRNVNQDNKGGNSRG